MSISDDSLTGAAERGDRHPHGELAVHRFARPGGRRRLRLAVVLTLVMLGAALGTGGWYGTEAAVASLVVALALIAAMWLAWFGEPTCTVRVEYGVLVLTECDREHRIDVAGADLEVVSAPGHRGWRLVVRRPGRRALVVDATMVDPVELTRVLGRWRPDLLAGVPLPPEGAADGR